MPKAKVIVPVEVQLALEQIGQSIRRARLARGETQQQAAERLGVMRQTIARIEAGRPEVACGHVLGLLATYGSREAIFDLARDSEQTILRLQHLAPKKGAPGRPKERR